MPTYHLTAPDNTVELLQADSARREGIHTVLRGTAYVMGKPREVVLRKGAEERAGRGDRRARPPRRPGGAAAHLSDLESDSRTAFLAAWHPSDEHIADGG